MYGGHPYGGVAYAASDVAEIPQADTEPTLAVEWSPTTGALETPVWVDITGDCRSFDVSRGRNRELERFQPGRATVVLSNRDRRYDSVYESGPNFGNLKPNRRIRIRATFNGTTFPIFDGFVDRWQLDYPGVGKDATATITATDAFKLFARTDLPTSVYSMEVEADSPAIWWRLNEDIGKLEEGSALNAGTLGTPGDGSFLGAPEVGGQPLIVNDPGSSLRVRNAQQYDQTPLQGVTLDNSKYSLLSNTVFAVEAWAKLESAQSTSSIWTVTKTGDTLVHAICGYENLSPSGADRAFAFIVVNSAQSLFYGVMTPAGSVLPGQINHVVCSVESGGQMAIWLNGTRYTAAYPGATATSLSGVTRDTDGHFAVGNEFAKTSASASINWGGELSEVAIYSAGLGDDRIAAHYEAGTTPWQDDLPSERLDRVLDLAEWPSTARELDAGQTTLQSAEIVSQSVLEHSQKVAETEFGLLYVNRAGDVRFVSRANVWARTPGTETYGDGSGEVGYTEFVPDDGDETIRNRATISRLNGVAQTVSNADSVEEFGRFDYVLEGLLHRADSYSRDYATTIVAQYAEPGRRITSLSFGPAPDGEEADHYPAILGRELGDYINVTNSPLGGGDAFEQVCAIEGIHIAGTPKILTANWQLSPRLGGELPMDWADYTPSNTNITVGNGTQTARFARAGNTVLVEYDLLWGSTTAFGGVIAIGLPVAAATPGRWVGSALAFDAAPSARVGTARIAASGTTMDVLIDSATGGVSSTVPFTWASTDRLTITIAYEAA